MSERTAGRQEERERERESRSGLMTALALSLSAGGVRQAAEEEKLISWLRGGDECVYVYFSQQP